MITYEYECESCGFRFERRKAITEEAMETCPECGGKVHQVISGGSGFMIKDGGRGYVNQTSNGCSLATSGRTCCGRAERCSKPPCEA